VIESVESWCDWRDTCANEHGFWQVEKLVFDTSSLTHYALVRIRKTLYVLENQGDLEEPDFTFVGGRKYLPKGETVQLVWEEVKEKKPIVQSWKSDIR
jgi:hypothetical protein